VRALLDVNVLISGDAHLLALEGSIPVLTPRAFFDSLK